MSNCDEQKIKARSMSCKNIKNALGASAEYGDFHNCDNVNRALVGQCCDISKRNEDDRVLRTINMKSAVINTCGDVIFSYLYHLATFSWQRRKRRGCKENNHANELTNYKCLLLFLVLSCSFLEPINATSLSTPTNIKFTTKNTSSSFNDSYMSKAHVIAPLSGDAKVTYPYLSVPDNLNFQIYKLLSDASRSREPRGKKKYPRII